MVFSFIVSHFFSCSTNKADVLVGEDRVCGCVWVCVSVCVCVRVRVCVCEVQAEVPGSPVFIMKLARMLYWLVRIVCVVCVRSKRRCLARPSSS